MNSKPWLLANICWDVNVQMCRSLSPTVREWRLSGTSMLVHGVTWLWVGGSPALSRRTGACVWLITALGLGPQALLRVWATCNLLWLITPLISKILTVLLDIWKFGYTMLFGSLICKANCLKCSKDFTHSHAESLRQSREWKQTLLPNPGCWCKFWVKYYNLSATAGPVNDG